MRYSIAVVLSMLVLIVGDGCIYPATEVFVQLNTNAPGSRPLTITATVRAGSATSGPGVTHSWIRGAPVDGGVTRGGAARADAGISLPATFAIVPGDGPRDGTVTLVVEASLAALRPLDRPIVFRRIARFTLTPREQTIVRVFLAVECGAPATGCRGMDADRCTVALLCEERGETCGDNGQCVRQNLAPMRVGDASVDASMDAAVDVTPPDARGNEGGVEVACPVACVSGPNQTAECSSGVCQRDCLPGFSNCDGETADGCEVDTVSDAANCGACGTACPARANATATCSSRMCGFTCTAPFADCNGEAADGCEVDTSVDLGHCGRCGNRCPSTAGTASSCTAGACGAMCVPGRGDCNPGMGDDGCETDLLGSTAHCGSCGQSCSPANASALCASGSCGYSSCNGGFYDLDGDRMNGCECGGDGNPNACGAAISLGTIAVGASSVGRGNIVPLATEDWFSVTFAPGGDSRIRLATNPGGAHRIEVMDACGGGPRACGADGTATGITEWQFNDIPPMPMGGTMRAVPWPATVFFRVYNTGGETCGAYEVTALN